MTFTTPGGELWEYSSEFNGYWVIFTHVASGRFVSGSIYPLQELSGTSLSNSLQELWARRKRFLRKV